MRTFTQRTETTQKSGFPHLAMLLRGRLSSNYESHAASHLQRALGNQGSGQPQAAITEHGKGTPPACGMAPFGHDFSQIPVHPKGPTSGGKDESAQSAGAKSVVVQGERTFEFGAKGPNSAPRVEDSINVSEKSAEGAEPNYIDDFLVEQAPTTDGGVPPAAPATPAPAPMAPPVPAPTKTAGVDSFEVKWSKHSSAGATTAKLRLDYTVKFTKDATHDPALADFRQSVMTTWEITDGPHKGDKGTTAPMHDDNYSRADDLAGNGRADVDFSSNDNPGYVAPLAANDVIDYSFTAEQTIIDTSQANKVIAKRGPHTGTIQGKHPRTYGGVPATLS